MTNIDFVRIASEAIPSYEGQIESRCCPDQYMGILGQILGSQIFPEAMSALMRPNSPCIIMVLESPHIDEYIANPGPAKGFTGEMIRLHLQKALPIKQIGEYGLILMNAIQYQCSLGVTTDLFRDRVFRASWGLGGRESLGYRVERLFRHGDILVNCCTKGKDYEVNTPLRQMVEGELRRALPGVRSIRRLHPSSWRKPTLASLEWSTHSFAIGGDVQEVKKNPMFLKKHSSVSNEHQKLERLTLVEVQENVLMSGARCTVLIFSNGSRQHMKTTTFDPQGLITAKAKSLLGMAVKTTCWNPSSTPRLWSSLGYFNDIYSV